MEVWKQRAEVAERKKERLFVQIMARYPSPFNAQNLHTATATAELDWFHRYLDASLQYETAISEMRAILSKS